MFVKLPQLAARQDSVWRTFSPLVEVDALVKQQYVEEIRDPRLVDGAIRGMLLELDPYSRYSARRSWPPMSGSPRAATPGSAWCSGCGTAKSP